MSNLSRLVVVLWAIAAMVGCSSSVAVDSDDEDKRILELLGLTPGWAVADVGAGEGDFSVLLAAEVGVLGQVIATEVEQDKVDDLTERAEQENLPQIQAVLGDQSSTGLSPGCCEAIFLRKVYHHFTDPAAMGADLWRSLKPGGHLLVIDFEPDPTERKLEGVPERGGHGILAKEVVEDLEGLGFETVQQEKDWEGKDDHYSILLRRP